jgi:YHS domain-containing protein
MEQNRKPEIDPHEYTKSSFIFLVTLGFELRALYLLGRHPTAWPKPPSWVNSSLTKEQRQYNGKRYFFSAIDSETTGHSYVSQSRHRLYTLHKN